MQFMFRPLVAYANFKGRARRAEYWQWTLLNFVIGLVCAFASDLPGVAGSLANYARWIWALATFIPGLAVSARRFHDINRSGWWTLYLTLVPVLFLQAAIAFYFLSKRFAVTETDNLAVIAPGTEYVVPVAVGVVGCLLMIPILLMLIKDGTPRNNRFGADPKGRGGQASIF